MISKYEDVRNYLTLYFPHREIKYVLLSLFDDVFKLSGIENIIRENDTITFVLEKERFLTGRITEFLGIQAVRIPKVVRMTLSRDSLYEIPFSCLNFSDENMAPESIVNLECSLSWVEVANRINFGTGLVFLMRHSRSCEIKGHAQGALFEKFCDRKKMEFWKEEIVEND